MRVPWPGYAFFLTWNVKGDFYFIFTFLFLFIYIRIVLFMLSLLSSHDKNKKPKYFYVNLHKTMSFMFCSFLYFFISFFFVCLLRSLLVFAFLFFLQVSFSFKSECNLKLRYTFATEICPEKLYKVRNLGRSKHKLRLIIFLWDFFSWLRIRTATFILSIRSTPFKNNLMSTYFMRKSWGICSCVYIKLQYITIANFTLRTGVAKKQR